MQLVIAGLAGLLGHGGQLRESCGIAKRSSCDHLFDPRDPRPLERSQIEPLDVAQDWSDDLWSPELKGECGRAEQAAAALARAAQLPGPSQRGDGHADRAALPRSPAASSSSKATSSCSPEISAARCQTRRSGSASSVAASASWARRRCDTLAL